MGSITVNPSTPLITGAAVAVGAKSTGASSATIIIAPTTAQSILEFRNLVVRFENAGSAVATITALAGANYSEIGEGNGAAITLGTSGSSTAVILVGGASFESARFQDADDYLQFTCTTAATVYVEATLLP